VECCKEWILTIAGKGLWNAANDNDTATVRKLLSTAHAELYADIYSRRASLIIDNLKGFLDYQDASGLLAARCNVSCLQLAVTSIFRSSMGARRSIAVLRSPDEGRLYCAANG
jgi:hypothetical protein